MSLLEQRFAVQAQTPPVRVALMVAAASAGLPVTLGVPLGEVAAVTDVAQLGVIDANGAQVPSQMRVLARWRGLANDTAKPLKWVLVDFKPAAAGVFYLTRAPQTVPAASIITRTETAASIRLKSAQLEIELPKLGSELVKSFKQGGIEQLRAALTAQAEVPRAVLVNRIDPTTNQFTVNDATVLRAGESVRFEKTDTLRWDADVGGTRLVMWQNDWAVNHRYRIEEGTARVEEVTVNSVPGTQDLRLAAPLRFRHAAGSKVRDLTVETETATIRDARGQALQFAAALTIKHTPGEKVIATTGQSLQTAALSIDSAGIEEANALRAVVRQDGHFVVNGTRVMPLLSFTLRYYVYADQPFVRVRLQLTNTGTYGFGAANLGKGTFAQHALLRSLSALVPTVGTASGAVQVLTSTEAHARLAQNQTGATLSAGSGTNLLEISVPEFTENFPKALLGDASGLRFNVLPNTGDDYVFEGARAKTTDFYLGRNTAQGRTLTNSLGAKLDPGYLASTGAVRPALVEKRNWTSVYSTNPELGQAGNRYEQLMASAYDLAACNASKPQSIFEYRQSMEFGENLGWRNFGDLGWGDGYSNLHYDLPFNLLREYVRTGDARAFQLGSELARYRADWGHYHGDDYLDAEGNNNVRGMAFYEKGDHGSFLEPKPSHNWIEGMWLYWALTGDESVRESALSGSEAVQRMNLTFDNALSWNEPRWLGWPTLALMAAWRYTGDMRYLSKARDNCYLFAQTEESFGRKGFYISQTVDWAVKAVQPWAWTGYAQEGVIEFWRETNDQRIASYLVRVADWYVGKGMTNPPLQGGRTLADSTYLPLATSYNWTPNAVADDLTQQLGGMGLQVVVAGARISGRQDLWDKARLLFRDTAFYRDIPSGTSVPPSFRATISFRSAQFTGSSTKAYGQTALTINDFLPELLNAVVLPRTPVVLPPPQPSPSPTPPGGGGATPTPTPSSNGIPPELPAPNTSGLINAAFKRPASASSVRGVTGVTGDAPSANDGVIRTATLTSAWHSALNSGQLEWWQVDLGAALRLQAIEITFRPDKDEPTCRRNFVVLGSNDASFATSVALTGRGETAVPFGQKWAVGIGDATKYRYLRIRKTRADDTDAAGQAFFNLTEVKVFAVPVPPLATAFPNTATLTNVALNKPATASSVQTWSDVTGDPASGNDGRTMANNLVSLWHSKSNTNQPEWWQTDLGTAYRVLGIEILYRPDSDQPNCRRNFIVLGSNTPEFDNPVVLGMREGDAVPLNQPWRAGVADTGAYRYVRVQKTDWNDRDSSGDYYFNLTELRLFADTNALRPLALSELTPKRLLIGQSLSFLLKKTDDQNRPVTLAATGLPEGSSFDAARGLFTFTPNTTQAGKLFAPLFAASGAQIRTAKQEIVVTLDGAPNVVLTAPTAGTQLLAGQYATISWATDPGARVNKFQVRMSVDGGVLYNMLLAEVPGNVGQYRWLIPANFPSSAFVRFMVTATDATNRVGLDYSKQDFRVSTTP
ncbi:MAG: discoidin domain-containing protein [Acidobacteria bacterium]|nr:discoidin domain-containing protein [Acidobacteriota bacterium]MBI3423947.1 discoidin domain-containing protein [Acidobacteriota bacterium]